MSKFKSDFLRVLDERGFIHQVSDPEGLDAAAKSGRITAYVGYDATATSLHIGNLISATMLYWLQETGHRPIALMGGGTSMIGDPSFRDEQRGLLTPEAIATNIEGIKKIFGRILKFGDGPTEAIMVNNGDWLLKLNYVEFLRDVGRHFSVNRMLTFDSVKLRLDREQSLSFLEFNYMILQGYDFVELNRRYGCVLQMGGSDQWGNIVNGIELGRRTDGMALFGLTTPLLTTASGEKMGKTAGGAVWLDPARLSPFDFWQFWRNVDDADLKRFLLIFSDIPAEEIDGIDEADATAMNEAKKMLADHATALVHGMQAAAEARRTSEKLFGGVVDEVTHRVPATSVRSVADLLLAIGFATSKSDGRRLIAGGAVRIGDGAVSDEVSAVPSDDGRPILVSVGRKRRALVELV
jgi:tyrosyl-tRNA synthetase